MLPTYNVSFAGDTEGGGAKKVIICKVNFIVKATDNDINFQAMGDSKQSRVFRKGTNHFETWHINDYSNKTSWVHSNLR